MGLSSCQFDLARFGPAADCRADYAVTRRQCSAATIQTICARLIFCRLTFCTLIFNAFLCLAASADPLRIATYNADLSADGPGLLLQSLLLGGDDPQKAAVTVIAALNADVLLLTGMDYDAGGAALTALTGVLTAAGISYPYRAALRPNSGISTGFDLNNDDRWGGPRDAMSYGRFAGAGGMAVLSKLPIQTDSIRDFSGFLWADLPKNLSPDTDPALRRLQRLSSNGHYAVPISLKNGQTLTLLAYAATPPVFDGPDDRNGRRNHDEAAFWTALLGGALPFDPPAPPFVLLGQTNLDPMDGAGLPSAIHALMSQLQDPAPKGRSNRTDPNHRGNPQLDTALYAAPIGGLRVDQILLSPDMQITASGVMWPPDTDPLAGVLTAAARHRPLWVDVAPP